MLAFYELHHMLIYRLIKFGAQLFGLGGLITQAFWQQAISLLQRGMHVTFLVHRLRH